MHFSLFIVAYFYFTTITKLNGVFERDLVKNILRIRPFDDIGMEDKRPAIGFLLAHPDDESMFFSPTLKLAKKATKFVPDIDPQLHFLYLSNGDSKGQGALREEELNTLCLKYDYNCTVLDDPNFRDGPTMWDPKLAVNHIKDFILKNRIRVLFTFDSLGVSGHPNHIATHYAAKLVSKELEGLKVFYLETLPLHLKYTSILSIHLSIFKKNSFIKLSPHTTLVNMLIHRSQFRFHVPLWSLFSSYNYLNSYISV